MTTMPNTQMLAPQAISSTPGRLSRKSIQVYVGASWATTTSGAVSASWARAKSGPTPTDSSSAVTRTFSFFMQTSLWLQPPRVTLGILYNRNVSEVLVCNRRSEEHTSELQSRGHLVCRLLLE